jgi:translation initiation factor IF-3
VGEDVGEAQGMNKGRKSTNKVKVTLMFRGRQIAHPEIGRAVVGRVAAR